MKSRIKNSQIFSNVKSVADDGLIELKTGEVASLIEVKAIDLSLTSKSEKQNFFYALKSLYQIKGLVLKCYKLDQKINLNNNKINLEDLISYFESDLKKHKLLEESKRLIEELEDNHYTISSVYYLVVIAKDLNILEKQLSFRCLINKEKKVGSQLTMLLNDLSSLKETFAANETKEVLLIFQVSDSYDGNISSLQLTIKNGEESNHYSLMD